MSYLVVYYSIGGNNKKIGQELASLIRSPQAELYDWLKKQPKPLLYFIGGLATVMGINFPINLKINNAQDIDLLVVVSPIWAKKLPPATRSFLQKNQFKKYAFLSVSGAGEKNLSSITQDLIKITAKKPSRILLLQNKEILKNQYQKKLSDFSKQII